jgi:hypothetical protein
MRDIEPIKAPELESLVKRALGAPKSAIELLGAALTTGGKSTAQ